MCTCVCLCVPVYVPCVFMCTSLSPSLPLSLSPSPSLPLSLPPSRRMTRSIVLVRDTPSHAGSIFGRDGPTPLVGIPSTAAAAAAKLVARLLQIAMAIRRWARWPGSSEPPRSRPPFTTRAGPQPGVAPGPARRWSGRAGVIAGGPH